MNTDLSIPVKLHFDGAEGQSLHSLYEQSPEYTDRTKTFNNFIERIVREYIVANG